MPNTIDSLQIKIGAEASNAESSIDKLVKKLDYISSSLANVDTKGLQKFSSGLSILSQGLSGLSGIKLTDYNRVVKGITKFESIDGKKIGELANALNPLANSMSSLGKVSFDGTGVNSFLNSITRLSNSNVSSLSNVDFKKLGNSIGNLSAALSNAPEVSRNTIQITNAVARLGASGDKIGGLPATLPNLAKELKSFVSVMAGAKTLSTETISFTQALGQLASAGNKTLYTANNLSVLATSLKAFFQTMSTAPQVSKNTIQMTQALAQLANSGASAGSATRGISSALSNIQSSSSKVGNALPKLGNAIKKILVPGFLQGRKSGKSLASTIGLLYAKFWMLKRVIGVFRKSVSSAQDYIEEFNYFSVAMNKVGQDSEEQWKKAGYSSAEEYADSFKTRFSTLQSQLTGYEVDYNTGEATYTGMHNLGLDLTEVMKYNAAISQITNSAGMLGETSVMTSKALSMLSADWSSLSNQDLSAVQENLQSGLVGNSRALYKYGIDTTKAGLAQTALNHGIKVNVTALDQQSKMQLRTLTMLEQSKVAYGDLARTINQPANQLRMLQAGFSNFSRTIGSLFMPLVEKLYPYLNAMVLVFQEFAQWIAKINGIKLWDNEGAVKLPDYESTSSDLDDYGDSAEKAAKKTKKLADNVQGFDILNKLQDNDTSETSGDCYSSGTQTIDLSNQIASALGNYKKIWDEAFKSNKNKAVQLAQEIKKALLSGWEKGDFTSLGRSFAKWVNKGLKNISWGKIKGTIKNISKSIATFLNGFIKKLDWQLVGKTISEGLNTGVEAAYTFLTTFNFLEFGRKLGGGINSAIENFDWEKLGKTMGTKLRGTIQFAFGLITTFNFSQLGKKIGDGINGFLEDMGKVDAKTGLTGWQELGTTISDGIKGIADTITTALDTVNWDDVGKSICQFLGELDWVGILGGLLGIMTSAISSLLQTAWGAIAESPGGVISAITSTIGTLFTYKNIKSAFSLLKENSKILFAEALENGVNKFKTGGIKSLLKTKLGEMGTIAITLTIAVASISWAHGKWSEIFDKYTSEEISDALSQMFKDAFNSLPGKIIGFLFMGGILDSIIAPFTDKKTSDYMATAVASVFEGLGTIFSGKYSAEEWVNGIKDAFSDIGKWFSEKVINPIKIAFVPLNSFFNKQFIEKGLNIIREKWKSSPEWFKNIVTKIKNPFSIISKIKNVFSDVWENIKLIFKSPGKWFKDNVLNKISEAFKNATTTISEVFTNLWSLIKKGVSVPMNAVIGAIEFALNNGVIKALNKLISGLNIVLTPISKISGEKYGKIGKFDEVSLPRVKVDAYKLGGFPTKADLFYANENGVPEMVGTMGGRTAVAPQTDIAKGIASATAQVMAPAIYSAMKNAVADAMSSVEMGGDVYLDGVKITKEVMKTSKKISKNTGVAWGMS